MSFLAVAGKKTTDVREFLRDAANTGGVKYKPEKGKKHLIYIPFQEVSIVNAEGKSETVREIIALSGKVHEWESPDGKYRTTICLKDVVRSNETGEVLNDGSCPICDKISNAWDIYRYRHDMEIEVCGKTGEKLDKHMEAMRKNFAIERKAKEARDYIYLLVVLYRLDAQGKIQLDQTGIPEYDLKVMKMSSTRVEKIQQQLENSGTEMPGSEIIFEYPNSDDARLVVSQSTSAPVFTEHRIVKQYPGLLEQITVDTEKFTWEGIERSFPEWQGMTTAEAKSIMDNMFEKWEEYKKQLTVNPGAKYLEYVGTGTSSVGEVPSLDRGVQDTVVQIPGGIPDVNKVFSGAGNKLKI